MNNQSTAEDDVPVWARSSAFLLKPDSSPYGFADSKGEEHAAKSAEDLADQLATTQGSFDLVWSPGNDRLVVPEQLELAHKPLRKRQRRRAEIDISNGLRMSGIIGAFFLWVVYAAWQNNNGGLSAVLASQMAGVSALLLFIFGALPLYQGWKLKRYLDETKASCLFEEVPDAQFDTWLSGQKIPVTYFIITCIALCFLVQCYVEFGKFSFIESVIQAGLLKREALKYPEITDGFAWWRSLTAPFLHGNVIHFLMNASGILYLGRRTELLARWPHLLIVFFCSIWVGSWASFQFEPDRMAVGASGGVMGLLGFLLVFEILHSHLVPRPAMRRLLAALVLVVVTGVLGVSFIDNAAHAGGLLAGAVYASIVFPSSKSFHRPVFIQRDKVLGATVGIATAGFAVLAMVKMLS